MIAVDASALVAIVRGEPERGKFIEAIRADGQAVMSAPGYFESAMVCESAPGRALFDRELMVLRGLGFAVVSFDDVQAELARDGFRRYGKGRHAAGLNFGDCFAYALAKALDAPLLFKGTDFGKTDVMRA